MERIRIDLQLEKSLDQHSIIVTDGDNNPKYLPSGEEGSVLTATAEGLVFQTNSSITDVSFFKEITPDGVKTSLSLPNNSGFSLPKDVTEDLGFSISAGQTVKYIPNGNMVTFEGKGINILASNIGNSSSGLITFTPNPIRVEYSSLNAGTTLPVDTTFNPFLVIRNGLVLSNTEYVRSTDKTTYTFFTPFSGNEYIIFIGF